MTNYERGRQAEYRTMQLLEAVGLHCIRSSGSHGPFDVVAYDQVSILFVQVKRGDWPSPAEMESLAAEPVPHNARKLVYRYRPRVKLPDIREVT